MNKLLSFVAFFSFVAYSMDQKALITKDSKESTTNESYYFLNSLEEHKNSIDCVVFNPTDSNELISNSSDGTIKIWDVKKGTSKIAICKDHVGSHLAVSHDGNFIAYCGDTANRIKIIDKKNFDTKNGPIANPKDYISKIVFHPKDSSKIITVLYADKSNIYEDKDDRTITFFDLNNDTKTIIKTDQVYDFALNPSDENTIVVGLKGRSKLYNIETQQSVYEFDNTRRTHQVIFNSNNPKECIFYNSVNKTIQIFNVLEKKLIRNFCIKHHETLSNPNIYNIALHPNGKELIVTSELQTHIFDTLTGNFIESLPNKFAFFGAIAQKINKNFAETKKKIGVHTSKIKNSIVSPNGKTIATYSSDNTIKLWNQN